MSLEQLIFQFVQIKDPILLKKAVEERARRLSTKSNIDYIGKNHNTNHSQLIGFDVEIHSNETAVFPNLIIDDMDIYYDFLASLGDEWPKHLQNELSTIIQVQRYIDSYFGSKPHPYDRMEFYADNKTDGFLPVSKMKGQNIGLCTERAAIAHNLLIFLGIDSSYEIGSVNGVDHAYLMLKLNNEQLVIYDPTNPMVYQTAQGYGYVPAISPISYEQHKAFLEGEPCSFNYAFLESWVGPISDKQNLDYQIQKPLLVQR